MSRRAQRNARKLRGDLDAILLRAIAVRAVPGGGVVESIKKATKAGGRVSNFILLI